jgi:starch phosphorylase
MSSTNPILSKQQFKDAVVRHLHSTLGTDENKADNHAWWKATSAAMQELVLEGLRKPKKPIILMTPGRYIIFLQSF